MELTEKILKNESLKRITHADAQKLRRKVIKCSQSLSVFGDLMLDFDLCRLDGESLVYILLLMSRRQEHRAIKYYLNTSLDAKLKERYLLTFSALEPKIDLLTKTDKQIAAFCGIHN